MTFPDFQRQIEWCQSYITNISLKAYKSKIGIIYYSGLPDV